MILINIIEQAKTKTIAEIGRGEKMHHVGARARVEAAVEGRGKPVTSQLFYKLSSWSDLSHKYITETINFQFWTLHIFTLNHNFWNQIFSCVVNFNFVAIEHFLGIEQDVISGQVYFNLE